MMRIEKCAPTIMAIASMVAVVSCDRMTDDLKPGSAGPTSVAISNVGASICEVTKSAPCFEKAREFGDDDFSISEYVCSIDDIIGALETKGSIITTGGINQDGKSFTVDGWGMVSPERGKPQELTNHLAKLTASYTGSGTEHWPWAGGANPKWVNESPLHIWSYYPAGKIDPAITIDDDGVHVANTASFVSYTTDNTDLLIAYNSESRQFEKDADGNHTYDSDGHITDPVIGNPKFDVNFYHALSAIEFELSTTTTNADIHSITLCYVDPGTKNIVTANGIATIGDCVATGSGTGAGTVSFSWSNLSNRKPLHYEFGSSQSVAGGYTSATGAGVLFMIPQEVSNLTIIVEFSKGTSIKYNTKVQTMPVATWEAGKYYKYKLSIGEFHVPGENLGLTNVSMAGLKNSGAFCRPETPINTKGVTKIGLAINGYGLGSKEGQTVYMYGSGQGDATTMPAAGTGFQFDFQPVTNIGSDFNFGTDNVPETYYYCYDFSVNQGKTKTPTSNGVADYFVFDTGGKNEFQLFFKPSADDNSGGFMADLQGLIVLEIEPDANIPANFPLTVWP